MFVSVTMDKSCRTVSLVSLAAATVAGSAYNSLILGK